MKRVARVSAEAIQRTVRGAWKKVGRGEPGLAGASWVALFFIPSSGGGGVILEGGDGARQKILPLWATIRMVPLPQREGRRGK